MCWSAPRLLPAGTTLQLEGHIVETLEGTHYLLTRDDAVAAVNTKLELKGCEDKLDAALKTPALTPPVPTSTWTHITWGATVILTAALAGWVGYEIGDPG
jgi:hypothetical protein